jgi:GT2 family glycosyltransferase/glycosyltransferase involved in cell wall biosynthesis
MTRNTGLSSQRLTKYRQAIFKAFWLTVTLRIFPRAFRRLRAHRDLLREIALISDSDLFDQDWYKKQYLDVVTAGIDPVIHYVKFGAKEGRNPSPLFSTSGYLSQYPDVEGIGINPLTHYLLFGIKEARKPYASPTLDTEVNTGVMAGVNFAKRFQFSLDKSSAHGLFKEAITYLREQTPALLIDTVTPDASIIIPVYGQLAVTLNCLNALCRHESKSSVEIIVLDDESPEDTQIQLIAQIPWLRYVRQEKNAGFTKNCNYAAAVARGNYLVFLNSDTCVLSGWLDELLATFKIFPMAGLVGSKLLNADGSLQEAGGVFWRDGSAWNYGRGDKPGRPQYNYARRVDYCSGAAIVVPKTVWQEVGGFDEIYSPAYCEDADLAFRLRERGYDTLYQPLSQVIHYEGITHGRDLTHGIKAYQVENLEKLRNRWQEQLRVHHEPGIDPDRAKDRMAKRRVLFLEHCIPTPDQDAGSLLNFNIMLLFRDMDFQVTFIPEDSFAYLPGYTEDLQRAGIEVLYAPYVISVEQHLQAAGERYDLVFLCRWRVFDRHIHSVRRYCSNAKTIFYPHDLHYLRLSREAEISNISEKAALARSVKLKEFNAIRSADATIVVSFAERDILSHNFSTEKIHVWPLILNVRGTSVGYLQRQDIVFVGGYQHTPNVDAVRYFAEEVMPLLRLRLPGVRFLVVGSNPPDELYELAAEDIVIVGFVEDLPTFLDAVRVSIAPLRFGAGIKGKIGTAMALGLPVVATQIAVEGMNLTPEKNVLVASNSEDLVESIVRVYQDEALWNQLSQAGIEFAKQTWSAEAAWSTLNSILQALGMGSERSKRKLTLYSTYCNQVRSYKADSVQQYIEASLQPVATVKTKEEFTQMLVDLQSTTEADVRDSLIVTVDSSSLSLDGFCIPCNQPVSFLVDMNSGGEKLGNLWKPNWRERMECPVCRMNNRQRLMATLVKQDLKQFSHQTADVYFMEQVTPIFQWALQEFPQHGIIGSEYLGFDHVGGSIVQGIRHEDVMNLSFADESFDLIISNDVFEHVPLPEAAFKECVRVLRPGGKMLATIPFYNDREESVARARMIDGKLKHLLPPSYHGNPISAKGSLVFTDFGWNMLNVMHSSGFSEVQVDIYASRIYGHMGSGQLVFRAQK